MGSDAAADTLIGHGGNDYLSAGRGDDVLLGGPSDEELRDWDGADVIRGHRGDDWISDVLVASGGPWTVHGTDAAEVFRDAYDGRRTTYARRR